MISKIKLSLITLKWNIEGWIDNSSPFWFRIIFWSVYHTVNSDPMELKN